MSERSSGDALPGMRGSLTNRADDSQQQGDDRHGDDLQRRGTPVPRPEKDPAIRAGVQRNPHIPLSPKTRYSYLTHLNCRHDACQNGCEHPPSPLPFSLRYGMKPKLRTRFPPRSKAVLRCQVAENCRIIRAVRSVHFSVPMRAIFRKMENTTVLPEASPTLAETVAQLCRDVAELKARFTRKTPKRGDRRLTRLDRCPFGYRPHPHDPAALTPDEDEQEAIERIVEFRQDSALSLMEICSLLDMRGRQRRGKRWSDAGGKTLVRSILLRSNAGTPEEARLRVQERIKERAKTQGW